MPVKKKKQSSKEALVEPYPFTVRQVKEIPPAFQKKVDEINKIFENAVFLDNQPKR